MGNHISNLPLQDMIAGVVRSATSKLAADEEAEKKVKDEIKAEEEKEKESCGDKTASWTDPSYVEKLASACDFISQNVDAIDTPNRGVLGSALAKIAEGEAGVPPTHGVVVPPTNPVGALKATASEDGKEKYKDDKPLAGYDSAASQADTPETTGGDAGGKTQIMNDMNSAPGQASGSVPTAEYPPDGPLHSGPTKTAGAKADAAVDAGRRFLGLLKRTPGNVKDLGVRGKANTLNAAEAAASKAKDKGKKGLERYKELMLGGTKELPSGATLPRPGNHPLSVFKHRKSGPAGEGRAREFAKSWGARGGTAGALGLAGLGGKAALGKEKSAADIAREKILRKLAGEDTMPATVSAPTAGGPLVGEGEMSAYTAEEVPSCPTDGSGYGNEARKNIGSNEAVIDTTKKDAKKVQISQLAQVLNNPAFSRKHDGRLQEQLRNTGEAGVKIAGAMSEEIIKQAAAAGLITQETINRFAKLAEEAPSAAAEDGCTCNGDGTCKVCKLKALKEKDSQGDMGQGLGDSGMGY